MNRYVESVGAEKYLILRNTSGSDKAEGGKFSVSVRRFINDFQNVIFEQIPKPLPL